MTIEKIKKICPVTYAFNHDIERDKEGIPTGCFRIWFSAKDCEGKHYRLDKHFLYSHFTPWDEYYQDSVCSDFIEEISCDPNYPMILFPDAIDVCRNVLIIALRIIGNEMIRK